MTRPNAAASGASAKAGPGWAGDYEGTHLVCQGSHPGGSPADSAVRSAAGRRSSEASWSSPTQVSSD